MSSIPEWTRRIWEHWQEQLIFLPPFPEQLDALALFGLLLIGGLLLGEWVHRVNVPKIIGYVLAGAVFGPAFLGWISFESLAQIRQLADAALGMLLLDFGRRLNIKWLLSSPLVWRAALFDIAITFSAILTYALWIVDLPVVWSAVAAAVTMASAPAVVLLTMDETRAEGQITERIVLHTAISSVASFCLFAIVMGIVHAKHSDSWLNAIIHPMWMILGSLLIAYGSSRLALHIAKGLHKGSLSQMFVLVAFGLLAIGLARMLGCPIFLTLFLMGVVLSGMDEKHVLKYTNLPEAHWIFAIVLFVVTGATLPWSDMTWTVLLQAVGLLIVRAIARFSALWWGRNGMGYRRNYLIMLGTQPLSVTAIYMTYEIAGLYPDISRETLLLPLLAAAVMELVGPWLCRYAIQSSGEGISEHRGKRLI